ncbi:unnamed protein product, partial [Brenthis ino]
MFRKLFLFIVLLFLTLNYTQCKKYRRHSGTNYNGRWGSVSIPPSYYNTGHSYPPSESGLSGTSHTLNSPWSLYPSSSRLSGTSTGSYYPPSGSSTGSGYPSSNRLSRAGLPVVGNQVYRPFSSITGNNKPTYPSSSGLSGSRIEPARNYPAPWPSTVQNYGYNNGLTGYRYH